MAKPVAIDCRGLDDFLKQCEKASKGGFKAEMELWLEALGFEFLDIIQDEIIRAGVVDTRLLLNSFKKGDKENVWEMNYNGLSLEIGTKVEYATYVNDGHWLNPNGVSRRFVPGYWSGHSFVYDRNAPGGMMLKQRFIEGYHYIESATYIFERVFEQSFQRKLEEWLTKYF